MAVSFKTTLWQGLMYPRNLLKGHMLKPTTTLEDLTPGTGAVIEMNGKKVAAYKDRDGKATLVSAICTHLGCVVGWNGTEKTWDCPCHGSRFATDGKVLKGPAVQNLPTLL